MPQPLPVGDVLNEAFIFGYRRGLTVFRFLWLPFLASGLFGYLALNFMFDASALKALDDAASLPDFQAAMKMSLPAAVFLTAAGVLAMLFIYSGAFASVFRLVALGEERSGLFQFRFDGAAQRVFWAQLILMLINYGVFIAAFAIMLVLNGQTAGAVFSAMREFWAIMAAASAAGAAQPSPEELQHLVKPMGVLFQAGLFSLPLLLFIGIRLTPFLAGSASENRLLLFGAFHMTAGRFWAILGVYVLFIMAMVVIGVVYSLAMSFVDMMAGLGGGGAFAIIAGVFGIISLAATVVYQVYMTGVQLALQAIIYRRLKTGE